MIIDDEYSQYEMFRIINKAGVDAMEQFKKELPLTSDRAEQLEKWKSALSGCEADGQTTEESVYNREYARIMVQCWEKDQD